MDCKFKTPVSSSHETFKGKFGKAEKVTLFTQLGKEGKKAPGPTTYNDDKARDKVILKRTLGSYRR